MKSRQTAQAVQDGFPDASALAALRAWHEGLSAREAVTRYLGDKKADGQSSRAVLGRTRRALVRFARERHREDLAIELERSGDRGVFSARDLQRAIEQLRALPQPMPLIGDDVGRWLPARVASALKAHGIKTLAELTVRIPRRRRWWAAIPGLGQAGARSVEAFFARNPELTERARALVAPEAPQDVVPWERLQVPEEFDGSRGAFRAPRASCILSADNDYHAVQAWLSLHESDATQRAYRKEAERLILWAIVERGKPLSSLTTEDAIAYRAFLRQPMPRTRWVGPSRPRGSPEWRPFAGALSSRSLAHALSVLGALFRWLIEQRYVLANPFAGIKVRGGARTAALDASRAFSDGEWTWIRTVADGLEWSHGWTVPAAQRLRFLLDFGYACGLRGGELVGQSLGQIQVDGRGDHWLELAQHHHRQHQRIHGFVDVHVAELAALDAAPKQVADQALAGFHHLVDVELGDLREMAHLGHDEHEHRRGGAVEDRPPPARHRVAQHLGRRAVMAPQLFRADGDRISEVVRDHRLQQRILAGVVQVERALGHACVGRHVVHAGCGKAFVDENLECRLEQLTRPLALQAPAQRGAHRERAGARVAAQECKALKWESMARDQAGPGHPLPSRTG